MPLLLPLLLLLSFGGKLLLLPFTPSIGVLFPLFRIKLLMIYCLVLLPPMTYLESSDVSILFVFKIMKETNFSLVLVYVVFLGMELVKKVIGVMIPLANVFVFIGMWSFGNTKCFTKLPHVPVSLISSIDPLPDLFLEESPTSLSESPPSITNVPSHESNELPALIIDVPTDTATIVPTIHPSSTVHLLLTLWCFCYIFGVFPILSLLIPSNFGSFCNFP